MLGSKFSLIFWENTKDNDIDWRIQISGGGELILRGLVISSKEVFEVKLDETVSYDTAVLVFKELGLAPKEIPNGTHK